MNIGLRWTVSILVVALASTFGAPASAEEPIATSLDTTEIQEQLGSWIITIDFRGRPVELYLEILDIDGKAAATFDSQRQPEPTAIEEIEKTDDGFAMKYQMQFGPNNKFDMTVVVSFDGDALTGSITEKSGVFTAELTGRRKTADDEGVEQGRRPRPTAAKLTLEGKKISIAFGNMKADSEDWKRLQEVKDGAIFTYTSARATKLYTDADLRFGEVLLKAENVAKDYPGVYSLWLKKSGGEWWLVFNEEPDIWGSQHRPEADVAEIPLTLSTADEEKPDLLIELVKEGDKGGVFRMVWGTQVWSAKFALAH